MTDKEVIHTRLQNQQIATTALKKPAQVVEWMGAMQAQEWTMVKMDYRPAPAWYFRS